MILVIQTRNAALTLTPQAQLPTVQYQAAEIPSLFSPAFRLRQIIRNETLSCPTPECTSGHEVRGRYFSVRARPRFAGDTLGQHEDSGLDHFLAPCVVRYIFPRPSSVVLNEEPGTKPFLKSFVRTRTI